MCIQTVLIHVDAPVQEELSGGLHRATTVYVSDTENSRLIVPESSQGMITCIPNI